MPRFFQEEYGEYGTYLRFGNDERLMYLAPELVSSESLETWLSQPDVLLQRQPNGGMLKITHPNNHEEHIVERLHLEIEQAIREHQYQEAVGLYYRAWQVTETNRFSYLQATLSTLANVIRQHVPDVNLPVTRKSFL
jgi:hypothetical protein